MKESKQWIPGILAIHFAMQLSHFGVSIALAQQDLEVAVPTNWIASSGKLSISGDHYRMGRQSLRWDWTGGDSITVTNPGINPKDVTDFGKHTCDFWTWNRTALPGQKLRIEFISGTAPQYWFDFGLDYTGWRRAVRSYVHDMSKKTNPSNTFTSIRIAAPSSGSGSFFFDSICWVGPRFTRIKDAQNMEIAGFLSDTAKYSAWTNVPDIAPTPPTETELRELATIRSRWLAAARGGSPPNAGSVTSAGKEFADMNIVEDANGIRGRSVAGSTISLEGWPSVLARDSLFDTATSKTSREKMLLLARHLLDQGLASNSNETPGQGNYGFRDLPNALTIAAPAYDAATKTRIWDFFRWTYDLNSYWSTNWVRSTDYIYCSAPQALGTILLLTPNDAESVRWLKGFKRHMEQFVAPSEGSSDGIKPDGLGFHHNFHHNAYMYAFPTLSGTLYNLRGTSFEVNAAAYQRLRNAFLVMILMSADGAGNQVGYYANSLCGRHPFHTALGFGKNDLRILGEWGGSVSGKSADPIVAQSYNRRYGTNDFALFAPYGAGTPPEGFYQLNYSPIGIYRRTNWVATIHGPGKDFRSSEIYGNANRYGRYQSYGALEILYNGGITNSGGQREGWDWNHQPGTTTIVLPNDKLAAENGREDVYSHINFAGALAFHGQCGLYACNFQEENAASWGAKTNHNSTFVWRKSWFCFDNQVICLGSDIANNDSTHSTATTLFQGVLATQGRAITLDEKQITGFPYSSITDSNTAHWLLDAYGTGYFVFPGTGIHVTRSMQVSPDQSGSTVTTTGDFAKAWLDHGPAPAGGGYEYVVFPGTSITGMVRQASLHGNATTKPYEVIQRNTTAHVVKWKADGRIGYAIFTNTAMSGSTRNAGLLTGVTRPCLMMTQVDAKGEAWVTVVDPDLNIINNASIARTLDFTLNGAWTLASPPAGASLVRMDSAGTTLRVTTQHGFPVNLHFRSNASTTGKPNTP